MEIGNIVSSLDELNELRSAKSIKYIITIGRRQPMHIGHKQSLDKIISNLNEAKIIYGIGSSNLNAPFFNPLTNPLSIEQQVGQFYAVFPEQDAIFLPIEDVGNMGVWSENIVKSLAAENIRPDECVVYFLGKEEDKRTEAKITQCYGRDVTMPVGDWEINIINQWGFNIWNDLQLDEADLNISARQFREKDFRTFTEAEKILLPAFDYLYNEIIIARDELTSQGYELPYSMFALTAKRALANRYNAKLELLTRIEDFKIVPDERSFRDRVRAEQNDLSLGRY